MKIVFISAAVIGMLAVAFIGMWLLKDQSQIARARQRLEAPGPPSQIVQGAAAPQRWDVTIADGFVLETIVPEDGTETSLFRKAGSGIQIIVMVMEPEVGYPAGELITRSWVDVQGKGATVSPIETRSYGEHSWVGYTFQAEENGVVVGGMAYASVDTASRGVKLVVGGLWPIAEDAAAREAVLQALETVKVATHQ